MPHTALRLPVGLSILASALLVACAGTPEPMGAPRKETLHAVTADMELIRFNAGQPQSVTMRQKITGLDAGEMLVGIDYRVARGTLYALSNRGRLFMLDAASARLTPVGAPLPASTLQGPLYGFDFNPAADRIRVVGASGLNLRLHPDTGALVDGNPNMEGVQPDAPLAYVAGDRHAGQAPAIVAAGYTYNKQDDKITTNYAIDRRLGVLVMQGSREGTTPVVSPNTGQLSTVGSLGLGELADASFDIADVSGAAFATLRVAGSNATRLYQIDLTSGRAQLIGTVAQGAALVGMAVEP